MSNHKQNSTPDVSEAFATSKKRTELATLPMANQAFPESMVSLETRETELLKELEEVRKEKERILLKEDKKQQRLLAKQARQHKVEAKLNTMSPENKQKFQEKLQRKEYIRSLSREEKIEYRQQKKEEKVKNMNPKQLERYQLRQQKRTEKESMALEQRQQLRHEKAERRQMYQDLKTRWTETIPDTIGHLIIDGNNMRGGGPRRASRDKIISHIYETIQLSPQLQQASVTVYFDHKPAQYEPIDGITIKFSNNTIADDLIVLEAQEEINEKSVMVVTSDRLLAIRLLDIGCHVMRNGKFNEINPNAPKRVH